MRYLSPKDVIKKSFLKRKLHEDQFKNFDDRNIKNENGRSKGVKEDRGKEKKRATLFFTHLHLPTFTPILRREIFR